MWRLLFSTNKNQELPRSKELDLEDIELGSIIGSGINGIVHHAQQYLGWWQYQEVAVKLLPLSSGEENKKYEDEKNLMEDLKNMNAPNIIRFIGFTKSFHYYFIVMEYALNGSLENYINNKPALPLQQKIQWSKEILQAIAFLHSLDIIHCDIKTANILLDKEMNVKLGDFGLANKEYAIQNAVGTPLWSAPELLLQKPNFNSKKSDIFSYSIFLWSLVAWLEPSYPREPSQFANDVVTNNFRQPLSNNFPSELTKIITLGWMKDPKKRPTAEEILPMLEFDAKVFKQ